VGTTGRVHVTYPAKMTALTPAAHEGSLLDALLDSWRRNNVILVNLLRALPDGAMDLRAADGSWTVAELFSHMHYCRLLFVQLNAPEFAAPLPEGEWRNVRDVERVAAMLDESARVLGEAVRGRVLAGKAMDRDYDHPVLLMQHFVWHEGYHHGQIKLALKAAGRPFDDEEIGRVTWDVWLDKGKWQAASGAD
jgi:uncharacterized damage-inducible protein DinB